MPAFAPIEVRLFRLSKDDPSGCRLWIGCLDDCGYGKFNAGNGETLAHRAAYVEWIGEIPDGTEIDHLCRSRSCINPEHLEAVPHLVNVSRGVRKPEMHPNALKTHCKRGHPLNGDNLIQRTIGGRKVRQCRSCVNARKREEERSNRAASLKKDPVAYRATQAAERRAQRAKRRAIHKLQVREV